MIVIIAGTRTFNNYLLLQNKCDSILKNQSSIMIISGLDPKKKHFQGADRLAKQYAEERGFQYDSFPADWKGHGKSAGPIRNEQMAYAGQALIAFWDGKSRGTADMIRKANERGLKVRIIHYKLYER